MAEWNDYLVDGEKDGQSFTVEVYARNADEAYDLAIAEVILQWGDENDLVLSEPYLGNLDDGPAEAVWY